jgi:nucleoside diphosphate kinase
MDLNRTQPRPRLISDLLHALPQDDWAIPRKLLDQFPAGSRRTAFLLIRPEAVLQGMVPAILNWLSPHGFSVTDIRVVQPHPRQLEELYRYTQVRLMDSGSRPLWWYMPRYYRLGPAVAVLLHRDGPEGAAERLTQIKGPSNPALSSPGMLRYDFGAQNMVMCVVHASDIAESATREACLFFESDAVETALRNAQSGTPQHITTEEVSLVLRESALPVQQERRPNFHQVLAGLHCQILDIAAPPGAAEHAATIRAAINGHLAHPSYERRTQTFLTLWRTLDGQRLLSHLNTADVPASFLTWSAQLTDTWCALTDEVIEALRPAGLTIDLWSEVSLETGLGFHDLVTLRTAPATDDVALSLRDLRGVRP